MEHNTSREPGLEVEYIIFIHILLPRYCNAIQTAREAGKHCLFLYPGREGLCWMNNVISITSTKFESLSDVQRYVEVSILTSQLTGDLGFCKCSLKSGLWWVTIKLLGMPILGLYGLCFVDSSGLWEFPYFSADSSIHF